MKRAIGILLAMAVILMLGACGPSANEAASQKAEEKGKTTAVVTKALEDANS